MRITFPILAEYCRSNTADRGLIVLMTGTTVGVVLKSVASSTCSVGYYSSHWLPLNEENINGGYWRLLSNEESVDLRNDLEYEPVSEKEKERLIRV